MLYLSGAHFKVVVVHVDGGDAVANLELLLLLLREGFSRWGGRGRLADLFDLRSGLLSSLARSLLIFENKGESVTHQCVSAASAAVGQRPTCLFTLSLTNLAIFFLGPSGMPISFRSSTVHMSCESTKR